MGILYFFLACLCRTIVYSLELPVNITNGYYFWIIFQISSKLSFSLMLNFWWISIDKPINLADLLQLVLFDTKLASITAWISGAWISYRPPLRNKKPHSERGNEESLASHLPEFLCRIWHLTDSLQVVEVSKGRSLHLSG